MPRVAMIVSTSMAFCRNMCLMHITVSPLKFHDERTEEPVVKRFRLRHWYLEAGTKCHTRAWTEVETRYQIHLCFVEEGCLFCLFGICSWTACLGDCHQLKQGGK